MNDNDAQRPQPCLGSLLRKARHWPPPHLPLTNSSPSVAAKLAKRQRWQPLWATAYALCLLVVTLLATPTVARAGADDVSSGTLFFSTDGGAQVEAPRLHTDVTMQVTGIVARVEVKQRFQNNSDHWVEGLYAFPLPENSAVDRMRMQIGERVIVGEIQEKMAAQQLYQAARDNGQHASLVEQHRTNLFRTSVANIGPKETITITIGYLQIVDQQAGRYSLRFPLTITPRYMPGSNVDEAMSLTTETPISSLSPVSAQNDITTKLADLHPPLAPANISRNSVSFDIQLDVGVPLEDIKSAYHSVQTTSQGNLYRVQLSNEVVAPDHDFELDWTPVVHGEPAASIFRERTDAGEHVLLMFMPPHESVRLVTPRELIFIVDTSGSMGGESITQARAALLKGLSTLTPKDKFNLIQFNSVFERLFPVTVTASSENVSRARDFVNRLYATGGTEMLPALNAAMGTPVSGEYLRQIVFMTDGAVGNEDQLMQAIHQGLGNARLFTVGIGSAPNGAFMRKAAQMGRGTFTYIGSTNEVDAKMSELLNKIEQPALTNIVLHWPDGVTPEYAPTRIGDLYAGEPVVVTARVQSSAKGFLQVTGAASGSWSRQLPLDGNVTNTPSRGVATLWARNRISDLMDQQASGTDDATIRAQVLPLALQYQLVTKYTSLVAVDRTPVRPANESIESQRIANTKPQGSAWPTPGYPKTATSAELQMLLGALSLFLALVVAAYRRVRA